MKPGMRPALVPIRNDYRDRALSALGGIGSLYGRHEFLLLEALLQEHVAILYIRPVGRNNKKLPWGYAFEPLDGVPEQLQGPLHLHPIGFERSNLYGLCVRRMEK